jgi:hypothetical protein
MASTRPNWMSQPEADVPTGKQYGYACHERLTPNLVQEPVFSNVKLSGKATPEPLLKGWYFQ